MTDLMLQNYSRYSEHQQNKRNTRQKVLIFAQAGNGRSLRSRITLWAGQLDIRFLLYESSLFELNSLTCAFCSTSHLVAVIRPIRVSPVLLSSIDCKISVLQLLLFELGSWTHAFCSTGHYSLSWTAEHTLSAPRVIILWACTEVCSTSHSLSWTA